MASFSGDVCRAALARCRGLCERCGRHVATGVRGRDWSAHHRVPAGMGGSRVAWVYLVSNCLVLCGTGTTGCHGWVESNRDEAYALGLLVRMGELPAEVPVTLRGGRVVLLGDGGDYRPVSGALAAIPGKAGLLRVAW